MSEHCVYERWGAQVLVRPGNGGAVVQVTDPVGLLVDSGAFPAVVAALYIAAGLPAPVVLERPELPGDTTMFRGYAVSRYNGSLTIGIEAERRNFSPAEARELAAVIAARADEADAKVPEPDPEDVEALRVLLRREMASDGSTADIARALLRAGCKPPGRET